MKFIYPLVYSLLAGVSALKDNIVPDSYIVELKSRGNHKRDITGDAHLDFYNAVNDSGIRIEPRQNFTGDLFHGTSFKLKDKNTADIIREFPDVIGMWPVKRYPPPAPVKREIVKSPDDVPEKDLFGPHIMTGVDKLHERGILGENVFVAVIDSGIDYTHPALGGCFGSECLVTKGRDLVGDQYTGDNEPMPDDDPLDCNGHGTHVAGIIAAKDKNFKGVAPKVLLGAWKVFGCEGHTQNDVLIQAFQEAADAGADIISASIGGPSGWSEDAWAVVASRLADRGVFVDSDKLFSWPAEVSGAGDLTVLPYLRLKPFEITGTFPVFVASTNLSKFDDGCDPLPDDTPDLSNHIVLVRRGSCTFVQKAENFKAKGARQLIYYNNNNPLIYPHVETLPTAMITAEDGIKLIKAIKNSSKTITLTFGSNLHPIDIPDTQNGGKISIFSTWGPTFEMYNLPHISAPGGNIFSTYPMKKGGYAILSGTSMATPYLTGVAALYFSQHGRTSITARGLRDVMSTNGIPLHFSDGNATSNYLAPTIQQGGGLINALNAVDQTTKINPGFIHLNDSARFCGSVDISIWNHGDSGIRYTFGSKSAATVYALSNDSISLQNFPPELVSPSARVSFYPNKIWVPPRDHGIVTVSFQEPKNLDNTRIPIYSGFIQVISSTLEEFHIPYMGIAQDMSKVQVLDRYGYPDVSRSRDQNAESIKDDDVFTLEGDDKPTILWRNLFGTALLDIKLVPEGNDTSAFFKAKHKKRSIRGFPLHYLPRDSASGHNDAIFEGKYFNEKPVPNGRYRFLLKALKMMADPLQEDSYETWLSPPFIISRHSNSTTSML